MREYFRLLSVICLLLIVFLIVACVPQNVTPLVNQENAPLVLDVPEPVKEATALNPLVIPPTPSLTPTVKVIIPVSGLSLSHLIPNAIYIPQPPYSLQGRFPELNCEIGDTGKTIAGKKLLVARCYDRQGNLTQIKVPENRELTLYLNVGKLIDLDPDAEENAAIPGELSNLFGDHYSQSSSCFPNMGLCIVRAPRSGIIYFGAVINIEQAKAEPPGISLVSFIKRAPKAADDGSIVVLDVGSTEPLPIIILTTAVPTHEKGDGGGGGVKGGGQPPNNNDNNNNDDNNNDDYNPQT